MFTQRQTILEVLVGMQEMCKRDKAYGVRRLTEAWMKEKKSMKWTKDEQPETGVD